MLCKGPRLLIGHTMPQSTSSPASHRAKGVARPSVSLLVPGGLTRSRPQEPWLPSHPPHPSRKGLRRHKVSKSHFISGDIIPRSARTLVPGHNLSLFSTWRCKEPWDGMLTWEGIVSAPNRR